jgi:GT2 family glycosyltransferase
MFRDWTMPRFGRKRAKPSVITLADQARDQGQWERAAGYYQEALQRRPRNPPIWVQYGHVLKEAGHWTEAERAYRTAIAHNPGSADAHLQLGHVLKIRGKKEEARSAYLRAVALAPSLNGTSFEFLQLGWSEGHVSELQVMLGSRDAQPNGRQVPEALQASPSSPALSTDAQLIAESGLFDPAWYRAQNPDLPTGMDPLTHYLKIGSAEGRRPNSLFDPTWYRVKNPDVVAVGMEPLAHYIAYGCAEGRRPQDVASQTIGQQVDPSYTRWVAEYDTLDDADRAAIRTHIAQLARRPLISVVVPVYNTEEKYLREMIESVLLQIYPHWELCLADDASTKSHVEQVLREFAVRDRRIKYIKRETNGHICAATNAALDLATGEFVALLDHDDLLSETAVYEIAVEVDAHPDADVIYSDSDNIDDSGRRWGPYFKTDWDPDLMLGHNMVNHLGVYRRSLLEAVGRLRLGLEGSQDYDLVLRVADASAPSRIRHIPGVLYHWRRSASSPSFSETSLERCVVAARRAIREHLARTGVEARIDVLPNYPYWTRVVYSLPRERPLVSIIVPTRDRADLLARCSDGVLTRTDYEPLELVIVDNDSTEPETHQLFTHLARDPRVRIIQHPGNFNYSTINNRAVQEARGDIVVLMNNDVDVISPLWLEEMVSQALRPEIGAVGAKLLYPDGHVQHAGVFLGISGLPGHLYPRIDRADLGSYGRAGLVRTVSAVTGACLAVRRSVFEEAGGLDSVNLAVAYNDIDLCLKIREKGYRNIWTPFAELYHWESASRGSDTAPQNAERFQKEADFLRQTWGRKLDCDPYYNPNCSLAGGNFEPGFPSRRRKPWQSPKDSLYTPKATMSRTETLLAGIDRSARIIEIGPSFSPIAAKADGWNKITVDHATRATLVEKYRGHQGVDVNRIEEVDFVWSGGSITAVVPPHLHGTFDAFIASHVIEHTTDPVGFLEAAETLLAPGGVVILAVPDKRFCFDYFRPLTTTAEILDARAAQRSRHTRRVAFEQTAYAVHNGGTGAWGQMPLQDLGFFHSLEKAADTFSSFSEDPNLPYTDFHAWQFIPASFELIVLELARLGQTDWRIGQISPATGCEFYAWLLRGGKAAAAALTEAQLNTLRLELLRRTLLETREQIEFALRRDHKSAAIQ